MNDILQLKSEFAERPRSGKPGSPKLPKSSAIETKHLKKLLEDLELLREQWTGNTIIDDILIDVLHTKVMAKSNRIRHFFQNSKSPVYDSIVGARFFIGKKDRKHIITYYISAGTLEKTINNLRGCVRVLGSKYGSTITHAKLDELGISAIRRDRDGISLSMFRGMIVDAYYIEGFGIPDNQDALEGRAIVTLYKTDPDTTKLMQKININIPIGRIINDTTILLDPPQIEVLKRRAPYLIAMATKDRSIHSDDTVIQGEDQEVNIAINPPGNEPTIGVIDTMFDESVYFSEWVQFQKRVADDIPLEKEDYRHGTEVSSIIVDGPALNPDLDDGCGRFKVRHFGVATNKPYSTSHIMKQIELIVEENPDIRVWNLSLGSDHEINLNSISPEASTLDDIQYKKDVVFIIAGTNKRDTSEEKRIGAPADSINSIVVNSVTRGNQPASYTRNGLVLSFFNKPDISSYGGDGSAAAEDCVRVCTPSGVGFRDGTSFAAPWVARKVAYLMEILGFSREIAKALIIDAAAGWEDTGNDQRLAPLVGHGIVPIKIQDVVQSRDDEIKFVISDTSNMYDTYTHNLPVPTHNGKYPFIARATLCYFPRCSRNQGVDYTDTDLDIYIGRVHREEAKPPGIKSINKNMQSADDGKKHYIYEGQAREWYRKWDNTKRVLESSNGRIIPRKVYESGSGGMWGISLKTKERLGRKDEEGIKFGIVVTLREIAGVNRIDDFIRRCMFSGWLVNKIDIESRVEVYNKAQENIELE